MFKNGQLVKCIDSSGSIHIAKDLSYRVSHDTGTEICLQGIPGYYNTSAFTPYYESRLDREVHDAKGLNHVDESFKTADMFLKYNPALKTDSDKNDMTLPTDSKTRKDYPLLNGCLRYFPAALAGVALISKKGNDKHNPGEELHHARGKSMDHGDCILRHLIDSQDLLAKSDRKEVVTNEEILEEVNQLAWRVLAYSQELHERFGAPLAPGAKK